MKFYLPTLKHLVIQLAKLQIYTLNLTTTFWHCKKKTITFEQECTFRYRCKLFAPVHSLKSESCGSQGVTKKIDVIHVRIKYRRTGNYWCVPLFLKSIWYTTKGFRENFLNTSFLSMDYATRSIFARKGLYCTIWATSSNWLYLNTAPHMNVYREPCFIIPGKYFNSMTVIC